MKNSVIIFEDLTIEVFSDNTKSKIFLVPNLIKDGEIKDFNYTYYLMNKEIEKTSISKDVIFVVNSSKFLSFEIPTVHLKDDEVKSFLHYELEKMLPDGIDYYYFSYNVVENTAFVRLIKKDILNEYKKLAENLKLQLVGFYYLKDSLKNANYINSSITHLQVIEGKDETLNYNEEISDFLSEYGLNAKDLYNYFYGNFEVKDSDILLKMEEKITFFIYNYKMWFEKHTKFESYKFFGDFKYPQMNKIQSNLEMFDFEFKNNFIEKKKSFDKKIIFALSIFFILNLFIFVSLDARQKDLETEKIQISKTITPIKEQVVIEEQQNYDSDFEKLVIDFDNWENSGILFRSYQFDGEKVIISGISDSTDLFEQIINKYENTKVISTKLMNDDLHFEIEIYFGENNENRQVK